VLAPVEVFARAITAGQLVPELLGWGGAAAVIVTSLYSAALALDANYLEAAARVSQKIQDRLQRARNSGGITFPAGNSGPVRWTGLPHFPWWGGCGPLARRQVLLILRAHTGMIYFLILLLFAIALPLGIAVRNARHLETVVPAIVIGGMAYVTFIISSQLAFAFRGDFEQMALLKSLPVRPLAVAVAQVLPIAVLVAAGEACVFGLLAALSPASAPLYLSAILFALPYNLLMFGADNLLFLLYPIPLVPRGQAGLLHASRVIVFMLVKSLFMLGCAAGIVVPALLARWMTGSLPAALALAWTTAWLPGAVLLLLIQWAFDRFDVSERIWE
jgi:hypothetical protein